MAGDKAVVNCVACGALSRRYGWVERKRGGEEEMKKVKSGVRWFSKVGVLGRSE